MIGDRSILVQRTRTESNRPQRAPNTHSLPLIHQRGRRRGEGGKDDPSRALTEPLNALPHHLASRSWCIKQLDPMKLVPPRHRYDAHILSISTARRRRCGRRVVRGSESGRKRVVLLVRKGEVLLESGTVLQCVYEMEERACCLSRPMIDFRLYRLDGGGCSSSVQRRRW